MNWFKLILVFFCFIQLNCFAQKTFSNLDSLLRKNYKTLSKRDTSAYISLINKAVIFNNKKIKSKNDSLQNIKPFKDAFKKVIEEIGEMVGDKKFTISYLEYETINKQPINNLAQGKIIIHVKLLVNSKFVINMPFVIVKTNNSYTIDDPMMVLFNDN